LPNRRLARKRGKHLRVLGARAARQKKPPRQTGCRGG
jgi:hypothetical protein